jgi:hypothetical protein
MLEEFIFALTPTERARIRPLQFRGIKAKIFLTIFNYRQRPKTSGWLDRLCKTHHINQTRRNVLLHEMLVACYHDIIPRNDLQLIQFLGNKQLFRHVLNELRRQERFHLQKNHRSQLENYYRTVLLIRLFYVIPKGNKQILDELDSYVGKYLAVKQSSDECDIYLLKEMGLQRKIADTVTRRLDSEKITGYLQELEQILTTVNQGNNPLVKFIFSFGLMNRYAMLRIEPKVTEHYKNGIEAIASNPEMFVMVRELFEVDYALENWRYKHSLEEVLAVKEFCHKKVKWETGVPLSFLYRFFPLILMVGDRKLARFYLRKHTPYNLNLVRDDVSLYYRILYIMDWIYSGDWENALQLTKQALLLNKGRSKSIGLESTLRSLDAYLVSMTSGIVTGHESVIKQIRYLRKHGINTAFFLDKLESMQRILLDQKVPTHKTTQKRPRGFFHKNFNDFMLEQIQRKYGLQMGI